MVALAGDVSKPALGLNGEDQRRVLDKVSVVFHLAASLRLEAAMKDAVLANTVGTKTVLDFCSQIKNLVVSRPLLRPGLGRRGQLRTIYKKIIHPALLLAIETFRATMVSNIAAD